MQQSHKLELWVFKLSTWNDVYSGDWKFKNSVLLFRLSSLPTYYVPKDGPLSSYKEYISMLPNIDNPEAFGQHPNADITSQIQETRLLFTTLLSLQPQITTGAGESREDKVFLLWLLSSKIIWHIKKNTVPLGPVAVQKCHHNILSNCEDGQKILKYYSWEQFHYNIILHMSLQWLRHSVNQTLNALNKPTGELWPMGLFCADFIW